MFFFFRRKRPHHHDRCLRRQQGCEGVGLNDWLLHICIPVALNSNKISDGLYRLNKRCHFLPALNPAGDFHAAGHIHRRRTTDFHRFSNVFRSQSTGKYPRFADIAMQHGPVETLSRTAVFGRMIGIKQQARAFGNLAQAV